MDGPYRAIRTDEALAGLLAAVAATQGVSPVMGLTAFITTPIRPDRCAIADAHICSDFCAQ
ncbi:MAG: hypothetical protein A2180_14090 [Pseudomonadales bacterium GWC2_63_15]|nr:MAG: hypothetical protein A2180_14090 [Pseudomonadales bacterium GWC2_63_15]